jgi:hypothetical protein
MAQHADAVAQDRAAGVRAGGIHRDDAHLFAFAAQLVDQPVYERAFARARRTGDADDGGASGVREKFLEQRLRGRLPVLHRRSGAGQRARIARQNVLRPGRHQLFSNCRAITMRWISLVPSPMVHSFASR